MRISPELWANIRAELFAHLRAMLLFFSWAIGMIAFMWIFFPPVPLPVPPVKLPVSLPVYLPPERLVVNGPLPVSGLPAEPVRLAFAGK